MAQNAAERAVIYAPVTQPSEAEAERYFRGLPSSPRLVARSNWAKKWTDMRPHGNWSSEWVKKHIHSVEILHRIVPQWNLGFSGLLVPQITAAIGNLQWNTIDVLRIGYERPPGMLHSEVEGFVALLIGVEPGTTWSEAFPVALKCKEILEQHGIYDVECLIKEGQRLRFGQPLYSSEPTLTPLRNAKDRFHDIQWTEAAGTKICVYPNKGAGIPGTKGLYLDLLEDGEVRKVALTCRHVAVPADLCNPVNEYRHGAGEQSIIQPTDDRMRTSDALWRLNLRMARNELKKYDQSPLTEEQQLARSSAMQDCENAEGMLKRIADLKYPSSRIMAHTLYAPPMDVSRTPSPWFRDWALLDLHPERHTTNRQQLQNTVSLESVEDNVWEYVSASLRAHPPVRPQGRTAPLKDILTESDIWSITYHTVDSVAKFGGATGFTVGYSNPAKSICREFVSGRPHIVEEWCILAPQGYGSNQIDFCRAGDSGSIVMNCVNGRVGGLLTGGGGIQGQRVVDVTYATPLERLLRDIRDCGFDVSLPPSDLPYIGPLHYAARASAYRARVT